MTREEQKQIDARDARKAEWLEMQRAENEADIIARIERHGGGTKHAEMLRFGDCSSAFGVDR